MPVLPDERVDPVLVPEFEAHPEVLTEAPERTAHRRLKGVPVRLPLVRLEIILFARGEGDRLPVDEEHVVPRHGLVRQLRVINRDRVPASAPEGPVQPARVLNVREEWNRRPLLPRLHPDARGVDRLVHDRLFLDRERRLHEAEFPKERDTLADLPTDCKRGLRHQPVRITEDEREGVGGGLRGVSFPRGSLRWLLAASDLLFGHTVLHNTAGLLLKVWPASSSQHEGGSRKATALVLSALEQVLPPSHDANGANG